MSDIGGALWTSMRQLEGVVSCMVFITFGRLELKRKSQHVVHCTRSNIIHTELSIELAVTIRKELKHFYSE